MGNCRHLNLNGTWVSLEMIPVWGMKISSPACSPLRSWTSNSWCHTCQNATWSIANPISWFHVCSTMTGHPTFRESLARPNPEQLILLRCFNGYIRIPCSPCPSLSSMESAHHIIVHVPFDSSGNPVFGDHVLSSKSSHIHLFMLITSHFLITFTQVKIQIY